jgi:hypothetical protein
LWEPVDVDEDHATHGIFDARARSWSPQLWSDMHRGWAALAILAIIGVLFGGFFSRQRS